MENNLSVVAQGQSIVFKKLKHEPHVNIEWTLVKNFNSLNNKGASNLVKLFPGDLRNGRFIEVVRKEIKISFLFCQRQIWLVSEQ